MALAPLIGMLSDHAGAGDAAAAPWIILFDLQYWTFWARFGSSRRRLHLIEARPD